MSTGMSGAVRPSGHAGPWLYTPRPSAQARARLFCFPYAGGTATSFRPWAQHLPPGVELRGVQPPGRGSRMLEPPFTDLEEMVTSLVKVIGEHSDKPMAFFGHSMGAVVAFELARRLRRESKPGPFHLFLSGRRAAQLPSDEERTFDLPEPEFLDSLRRLNGTPREVFEHAELLQLMLPLLRADFSVCQTYDYRPEPPLNCPITVFGGVEDPEAGREALEAWSAQTSGGFTLHMLPGDHFFVNTSQALVCRLLAGHLGPHV
jgi:medium-chain acyl-[acyl-carrier-protein] hydrolase